MITLLTAADTVGTLHLFLVLFKMGLLNKVLCITFWLNTHKYVIYRQTLKCVQPYFLTASCFCRVLHLIKCSSRILKSLFMHCYPPAPASANPLPSWFTITLISPISLLLSFAHFNTKPCLLFKWKGEKIGHFCRSETPAAAGNRCVACVNIYIYTYICLCVSVMFSCHGGGYTQGAGVHG